MVYCLPNDLPYNLVLIKLRLLIDHSNATSIGKSQITAILFALCGDDAKQGVLSLTIQVHYINLGAVEETK